jgi:hypothetical protein
MEWPDAVRVVRGMIKFTHAIKRLFATGDGPAPRPVPAALIEAVEGRMLMSATLTGTEAPAPTTTDVAPATVLARKAGGTQQSFLVVTMSDVLISSYQ